MAKKYVYLFKEGNANMRELLGGKGANLAEMTNLGMPVPQGFTVTTEACTRYYTDGKVIGDDIVEQIYAALAETEKVAGKKFGDDKDPFLVSVRSGARASMPGMMDTILNLGLTDVSVVGLANLTNNPHFAYDAYRRFIAMFSDVVMEIPKNEFEAVLDEFKEKKGVKYDRDLSADDLKEVVVRFKEIYKKHMGVDFPQDPKVQLMEAVKAVFRSWDNPRANVRRAINALRYDGVGDIELLTGDMAAQAQAVAEMVGVDGYQAQLLPEQKAEAVLKLQTQGNGVVMVGDGINDAPALAYADVGISLGSKSTDIAMETSDVVINRDDPMMIPELRRLARATMRIVQQNFAMVIGINTVGLILGAASGISVLASALMHNMSTILVVANSLRLMVFPPMEG